MDDPRSRDALDVAERYANGKATKEELRIARDAALDAVRDAARDANDAWAVAWAVAWDAARAKQEAEFRRIIS
jgi:Holliday junction resolvasome RuvABC endonuclease subunit